MRLDCAVLSKAICTPTADVIEARAESKATAWETWESAAAAKPFPSSTWGVYPMAASYFQHFARVTFTRCFPRASAVFQLHQYPSILEPPCSTSAMERALRMELKLHHDYKLLFKLVRIHLPRLGLAWHVSSRSGSHAPSVRTRS